MPTTLLHCPSGFTILPTALLRQCAPQYSLALMLLIVIHTCLLLDDNYFDLPQLCKKHRLKPMAFVPFLRRNFLTVCNILVS